MEKILKKINGLTLGQAAEMLNMPMAELLRLINKGLFESISVGGQGVDGVTYESVSKYIQEKAEEAILKKTLEKAHKGWSKFFEQFYKKDPQLKVEFGELYRHYAKWTASVGLMTLDMVALGEYLEIVCKLKDEFIEGKRYWVGIADAGTRVGMLGDDPLFQSVMLLMKDRETWYGTFKSTIEALLSQLPAKKQEYMPGARGFRHALELIKSELAGEGIKYKTFAKSRAGKCIEFYKG